MRNRAHAEALPIFFPPPPRSPIQCPAALPSSRPLTADPATQIHPSQGCLAIDNAGQACLVAYMYGVAQAMALAAQSSKTPFDPRSLNLPSMGALVEFYHACLGFPVKQTWLNTIKAGNCDSSMGSPTPMLQDTARIQTRQSWVISPSNARMFGQQSPGLLSLNKSRCFQQLPPKHQASLPTKSTSVSSPSASSTRMTLDNSPSRPVPAIRMS